MPTYEYECERKHRFEQFQPITEAPLGKCPKCGSKTKRLIGSGAGFLFKGSGFYQTDYRSGDYKKKAESEKKPEKKEAEKQRSKDAEKQGSKETGTRGSKDAKNN